MEKYGIVVHGGAGGDSEFIRTHKKAYEAGLSDAVEAAHTILKQNGTAVAAVEAAIISLENNSLFNCGRGSALNILGEVEMDASIMDGKTLNSGAVAIVKHIKNPISLAKSIMTDTNFIYLGAEGALNYAKKTDLELKPSSYFITEHQYDDYEKMQKETHLKQRESLEVKYHGTVGAVALDKEGNLAAATSTGGTNFCKEGRIADSSMIGVGTYANNETCAVSCTGDGEYVMRGVIANTISNLIKYKGKSLKQACKHIIHQENKGQGDLGVIGIDPKGNVALEFNSERMHRAWKMGTKKITIKIYKDKSEL